MYLLRFSKHKPYPEVVLTKMNNETYNSERLEVYWNHSTVNRRKKITALSETSSRRNRWYEEKKKSTMCTAALNLRLISLDIKLKRKLMIVHNRKFVEQKQELQKLLANLFARYAFRLLRQIISTIITEFVCLLFAVGVLVWNLDSDDSPACSYCSCWLI